MSLHDTPINGGPPYLEHHRATAKASSGPRPSSFVEETAPRVLALLPSEGLGGGIEAYVKGVLDQVSTSGALVQRLVLTSGPGRRSLTLRKVAFAARSALRGLRGRSGTAPVVVCFHAGLLPVAILCRALSGSRAPVKLFCYGAEIWSQSWLWRQLVRRSNVRLITISDFMAGALVNLRPAAVLMPWYPGGPLAENSAHRAAERRALAGVLRVLSVFRLEDFERKGGRVLLEAVERLRSEGSDVRLTVAGVGEPNRVLDDLVTPNRRAWLHIVRSPDDTQLATLYRSADLFVLATRLEVRPQPYGEGFGIVLLEAALASLPVVAPAAGGGHAAFLEGVTGLRPADESVDALTRVLAWAGRRPDELRTMGRNGQCWATRAFDPERRRKETCRLILDGQPGSGPGWLDLSILPAMSGSERV